MASLPFDAMFGDEWVFDNADRDTTNGYDPAATIYQTYGPAFAALSGTYTGTIDVEPLSNCEPDCLVWIARNNLEVDPASKPRTFVLDLDCSNGVPCEGTGEIERAAGVETASISFDGVQVTFLEDSASGIYCEVDAESDGVFDRESGEVKNTSGYELIPSTASVIDGRWTVDTLVGFFSFQYSVVDAGECPLYPALDGGPDFPDSGGYFQNSVIEMMRIS